MTFNCTEACRYLDAWVDGELDPGASLMVDAHVNGCSACGEHVASLRTIRSALGGLRESCSVPPALRLRLRAALEMEDARDREVLSIAARRRHALGFLAAAAALSAVVVGWSRFRAGPRDEQTLQNAGMMSPSMLDELVSRHARDLPVEVRGNEPAQVVNFFRGRLDVPVRPVAFRGLPAQLVGARISSVGNRMAAALYYDLRGRRMTVFVFEPSMLPRRGCAMLDRTVVNDRAMCVGQARGYSVAFSEQGGVGYAVATDLPAQETVRILSQAEIQ